MVNNPDKDFHMEMMPDHEEFFKKLEDAQKVRMMIIEGEKTNSPLFYAYYDIDKLMSLVTYLKRDLQRWKYYYYEEKHSGG